ncbi:MAG: response regulator [Chromatiales bacterium]|jgi:CheY-like chemotaxis protein
MAKRALIVDDSKTAREVLSNKLQKFGILVAARESAAAAIDYLYEETPDAIFMDYEMPGMDGFQALKVIKSNPNTALIPVMMYTSKAGGLALSQARALGAVGVLPKQLETQDLEELLRSLHLMPDQDSLVYGFQDEDLAGVVHAHRSDNVRPLHAGDKSLNRPVEHVSLPLEDIPQGLPGTEGVRRSLRKELAQAEERLQEHLERYFSELHAELFELEDHQEEADRFRRRTQLGVWFGTLMAFITLVVVLYAVSTTKDGLNGEGREAVGREVSNQLALQEEKLNLLNEQMIQLLVGGGLDGLSVSVPLGMLEWAANQGGGFNYAEMPFDDKRALWLSELVEQLKQVGFKGAVELRSNYGNFCLKETEGGEMVLANPDLDIAECQFAADVVGSESWRNEQSVAFANYINVELANNGGEVEIILFSNGFTEPQLPYPEVYEVKTAGEWNRIARVNQRVRVSLYSNP